MNDQKQQIIFVAENLIDPNPRQPRKQHSEEADFNLCQSIKTHGIFTPLLVKEIEKRFQLIAGQRRLTQGRCAGVTKFPCIPITADDLTAAEIAIIENELREQLAPLDLAEAVQDVMTTHGLNGVEAGARLNLKPHSVTKCLAMLRLPDQVKTDIRAGKISPAKAYELSKVDDPVLQMELAQRAVSGATRDEIAGAVKRTRRKTETTELLKRVTAKLSGDRAVTVQGVIGSLDDFINTLVDLLSAARKARTQGVEVGTFVKMMSDLAKTPA